MKRVLGMVQQTIRVALIEDNVTDAARVTHVLKRTIGGTDFTVDHFLTLASGLEALRSVHFDVLLLDLGLPDSRGVRALSKVRAVAPRLPILVLAGSDVPPGVSVTIRELGFDQLLKSRMTAETMLEAVLRVSTGTFPDDESETAAIGSSDGVSGKSLRVLVVEDDHGDLAAIRFLLASVKTAHFEIRHAATLASALPLLEQGTDVILLDLNLPDSNGLPTLTQVRGKDPHTPVIVLAQGDQRPMAVEALGTGAQDYLVKGQVDSYLLGQTILRRIDFPVSEALHTKHQSSGGRR